MNSATPNTAPSPIRNLDQEVEIALELTEQIKDLQRQLVATKARIAQLGVGKHQTSQGITVTVSDPPRSFDLEKAWSLLTPEQQAVCQSPDSKKIRQQLPPVLAEQCMAAGTGKARVTIS